MEENSTALQNVVLVNNTIALNSMPYCVFWKDKKLNYVGGNSYFLNAIGASSLEEILGKSDYDCPWAPKAKNYQGASLRPPSGGNLSIRRDLQ